MKAVRQYLERHAEPETALAADLGTHDAAAVLPAYRERELLPGALDALAAAGKAAAMRLLVLVVVNAPDDASAADLADNAALCELLGARGEAWDAGTTVSVIRRRVPRREGVGLARKIGADVALALWDAGRLGGRWILSTDADARVPADLFARLAAAPAAAGATLPFVHERSADPDIDRATVLYDISLRYYRLGLAWAGSPYAHHSLGSALAVDAESYAKVRGFPRRAGAEDFHMLDKLAKVGPLAQLGGEPIRILPRRSDRVPFGTGRAVARQLAAADEPFCLYHPGSFGVLTTWLSALGGCVPQGSPAALRAALEGLPLDSEQREDLIRASGVDALLAPPGRGASGRLTDRAVDAWFDGLRTLQLIHALRDTFPDLPWDEALAVAPFIPTDASLTMETARELLLGTDLKR